MANARLRSWKPGQKRGQGKRRDKTGLELGMKESYREDLASCSGLEPYAGDGNIAGVASARGNAGQPLSSEIITSVCRSCSDKEKATSSMPIFGEAAADAAESENLCMCGHSKRENREILLVCVGQRFVARRNGQKTSPTAMLT